jgi:hypothetical protein
MNRKMKGEWLGVTYPVPRFLQVKWFWSLWKHFMCPHGWHLLDENLSLSDHSLYCDACELDIPLADAKEETK